MNSWVAMLSNVRDEELERKFTNLTASQTADFRDFRAKFRRDRPFVESSSAKVKVLTWKDSFLIRKLNKYIESGPSNDGEISDVGTYVLMANEKREPERVRWEGRKEKRRGEEEMEVDKVYSYCCWYRDRYHRIRL